MLAATHVSFAATVTATYDIYPGMPTIDITTTTGGDDVTLLYGLNVLSSDSVMTALRNTPNSANHSIEYALYEMSFAGDIDLTGATPDATGTNLLIATLSANTDYVLRLLFGKSNVYHHEISATEVSPIPLPAAAWLFGSALLGFMAMSNRRRV